MNDKAQAAVEYLLLLAIGLAVVIVGVALASQLKTLSDSVLGRVDAERNSTLSMLVR